MKKRNNPRIIEYMKKHGSMTSLDAFRDLGITRLAAVVKKLRDRGYDIKTIMETGENRYGEKVRYARYVYTEKEKN